MGKLLNISIVLYKTPEDEWKPLVEELLRSEKVHTIYLIDNSPEPLLERELSAISYQRSAISYQYTGRNLGYGAANNIAMRETIYDEIPFHLVINSDIQVTAEAIDNLLDVMQSNGAIGQLMPRVVGVNADLQYLCKLLPTPTDLLRRILFGKRGKESKANQRFELRHLDHTRPINAPYLSGCFMLLRTEALLKAGLFDERFFMYPEDIDLTRRIHRDFLTLYYPSETIVHAHRQASYHSIRMLWIHAVNMIRYFNKWGWIMDKEREAFNKLVLNREDTQHA
ncbi:MAG: glycosyltransferase [Paludibacteraceae bacterium]|nr:glycosyltransferase [Paludibacteraceae bacterium]